MAFGRRDREAWHQIGPGKQQILDMLGDVEYASSLFERRPFLFINNAADYMSTVQTMLSHLRDIEEAGYVCIGRAPE